MKTIYLCENAQHIKNVYGTDDIVYSKKDVLDNPNAFADTDYIFSTWGMPVFAEKEIKKVFPCLKAVFYGAGSVKAFAAPFINCGVKVFSAWAANAVPVAEYTVAQIILANKGFFKAIKTQSREVAVETCESFTGNYGAKVGIIGAGMIGKLVIEKLKDINVEVFVFDPFLSDEQAKALDVKKCLLETIFKTSNVVSNHLADNEQTRGMFNKALFESMPQFATFINTGRGAQVIESELIDVLEKRSDLMAVLDVTYPEPPEIGSKLYTLSNCILTPHIAGSSGNEVKRMGEYMKQEFEKLINNKPTKYEVTYDMLKTMA